MMLGLAMLAVMTTDSLRDPAWMWGVTIDNLDDPALISDSLRRLPARPTTRLVFDQAYGPASYREAVAEVRKVGPVIGEPIDSVLTKKVSPQQYRDRMVWYMEELKGLVDIWEIGNEVNGDWGGESEDVAEKITRTWVEARQRRLPTALTLFYSDHYLGTDREMDAWSRKYLRESVRNGIDYVLVSFYPQRETGDHPDWKAIFSRLGETFPNAKLGFGELGLAKADYTLERDVVRNQSLIRRYYRMSPPIPKRFIGGYFWWTFRQDGVPAETPIWKEIAESIRASHR
jgi:hypothetical protein